MSSSKKNSRWSRYDPKSKLWIKGKLIYLYWFKFLRHAETNPEKEVNWKMYPYWGGSDVVCSMKFEEWWRPRWKRLFGYKDPKSPDPMFSPNYPHIRTFFPVPVIRSRFDSDSVEVSKTIRSCVFGEFVN